VIGEGWHHDTVTHRKKAKNLYKDSEYVEEVKKVWRQKLKQKLRLK